MTILGYDATPLLGQRSGVGHYTKRLISAVMDQNPEWQYHLYSNRPLGRLDNGLQAAREIDSYLPASRWLWMQTVLPQTIRRYRPDLVHFTNSLAPLQQPRPYVVTVHDASLFLYRHYHPWSRIAAMRVLLPAIARRAAAIITPTHSSRRDLLETLRLSAEKVHVVYEAAPDWFHPVTDAGEREALRAKYALPEEFVLFLGTLEPRKNLERLVRAIAAVHRRGHPVPLILAGPLGWHLDGRGGLQETVRELNLGDHVRYLGYVPTPDLPGLLSLATVFAFPSLYEGFGLPAVEAMACGAAILTSRDTAMAEICDDAACLIDPYSLDNMADGLEHLLVDAEMRQCLSGRALRRARQFSWERAATETTAIYRQVLGQ